MIILHVDSSILGPGSASRALSAEILAAETARNPDATVRTLDLAVSPITHLTGAHLAAAEGASPSRSALRRTSPPVTPRWRGSWKPIS